MLKRWRMPPDYLHKHSEFADLIRIVGEEKSIDPALVEKDYWIMHCLYGLQQLKFEFELKGGTSLSKGYGIIDRFSEDIDIRIEPPTELEVKTGPNQKKAAHIESRKGFYDWLAEKIVIDGISDVERDHEFDDDRYRSGGIRLNYPTIGKSVEGLKAGILLEVGFDSVTPNMPKTISSWAYDYASGQVEVSDNRASDVACYHPGYTFVEKLQTISTKFRKQQEVGAFPINFMRHYYDIYRLLKTPEVMEFFGTDKYQEHKEKRFRTGDNLDLSENEAFLLSDPETRKSYAEAYQKITALFYGKQPEFEEILEEIKKAIVEDGI